MENGKWKTYTLRQYLVNLGRSEEYRLEAWHAFRNGYEDARLGVPFSKAYSISVFCIRYEEGRNLVTWARDLAIELPPFRANDSWCPKWLEAFDRRAMINQAIVMEEIKRGIPKIPNTPVDSQPQLY